MPAKVGLTLALAFALALAAVALVFDFKDRISTGEVPQCEDVVPQNLKGSAGDGQVTLKWSAPAEGLRRVKGWSYEEFQEEESQEEESQEDTATEHGTGSTATSHVVLGLTNDMAYSFRVRAILESGQKGCWSNAVEVTPVQPANVLEAMEEHQRKIAANTSKIAAKVAVGGALAKELGERGVAALEALAKIGKRDDREIDDAPRRPRGLDDVSKRIEEAGQAIADGLADNGEKLEALSKSASVMAAESTMLRNGLSASLDGLSESVDKAGEAVADGLARIEKKLGSPGPITTHLCDGEREVGSIHFARNSYSLADDDENLGKIAGRLQTLAKGSSVLVVGYASAVGFAVHNLHLSELRALCTARCLGAELGDQQGLAFREIAEGEALEGSNLEGNSGESRRVDVFACPETATDMPPPSDGRTWFESATVDCGCSTYEPAASITD